MTRRSHHYRFETRWRVDATPEDVFAVLTDTARLTEWWPAVYRRVEETSRGDENGIGRTVRLRTQGWLPYRLDWELRVTECRRPARIALAAWGDFEGTGVWTIEADAKSTRVTYVWDVLARKHLLRALSFLLRPVFSLNHRWAMARGLEGLQLELRRRRGGSGRAPRRPVSALGSSALLAASVGALAAGLLTLLSVAGPILGRPAPGALDAMSEEELRSGFRSAMADIVLVWDTDDPRTPEERLGVLYDFVYQTYNASAWIPQALFDSNVFTQAIVGDVETIVRDEVGLAPWPGNPLVPAFGMAPNAGADAPLLWTVNCLVCHTAEIDGVVYFGAGTKTFDDLWLGESLKRLTSERWRKRLEGTVDYEVAAEANRILNSHHHDKIDSMTRGRSTAFAASHVELYLRNNGKRMPAVEDVGRGDVKTPPLWHTAAKMPSGRWYSDGSFRGTYPLMASSMELEKDRSFDDLVEVVIPRIVAEFDSVLVHLRPPPYPYDIDLDLAARGRELFESPEVGCATCHGAYDGEGDVDWPGVHRDVGTDAARRDLVSAQFVEAFDQSPLAPHGDLRISRGYAATPLTGVWANFPYLHNGSVPTLHHLLGPVSERPHLFEVLAARTLDRERVGQPLYRDADLVRLGEAGLLRRFGDDRSWFNTARPGSSNAGHDVWSRIGSHKNRRAIIEYLKTL